jgi:glycolate oxidase iron-sulfur subunit
MQTELADFIRNTPPGQEAERILRACVHCGFCTATCPTYQLLGDELDGPRGRIYQIKQVLEGMPATARVQQHLDRCLTCRSCETTCPSGVQYSRLLEIGREVVDKQVKRGFFAAAARRMLLTIVPYRQRFAPLVRAGGWVRPLLPQALRHRIPVAETATHDLPPVRHERRVLVLKGCAQSVIAPRIDRALANTLDRVGISVVCPDTTCCGALPQHLSAPDQARELARRNIDLWWPEIEAGAEAVVVTATGCGATVREYGQILADDEDYAEKAARVAALTRDPVEILSDTDISLLGKPGQDAVRVAFHTPCTLQHALKLDGRVEQLLQRLGFELATVADRHLCCGSAGSYSLLQPGISGKLRDNKLIALTGDDPGIIATANIGCLEHLGGGELPVVHWLELLDTDSRAA